MNVLILTSLYLAGIRARNEYAAHNFGGIFMFGKSRGHCGLHSLLFAALIGSSTIGAFAQDTVSEDCELAVAAMINLAQTNLMNNEAMVQLSLDKLKLLTALGGNANSEMVEAMSAMDQTIDGAGKIDGPVVAGGIAAMRRMCPDAFAEN